MALVDELKRRLEVQSKALQGLMSRRLHLKAELEELEALINGQMGSINATKEIMELAAQEASSVGEVKLPEGAKVTGLVKREDWSGANTSHKGSVQHN